MWFNNALIFNYEMKDALALEEALASERLKPCPPHARFIHGWVPAYGDEYVQEVAGCSLICLGKEERILPKGVIKHQLEQRVKALEAQHGRTIKRAEKAQMAEDLEFELLPKSFCIQKRMTALMDTSAHRLIINTASETQAAHLTALLRKSIPGLHLEPLFHPDNLARQFAEWLNNPVSLPAPFQLASDCILFALDNDKKRVSCKGYELPAEEITTLLSQGLVAAELSLIWNERIQFTLTHELVLKRLKSLDVLVNEFHEAQQLEEDYLQQDATLALLGGELRCLINDLMAGLAQTKTPELALQEA